MLHLFPRLPHPRRSLRAKVTLGIVVPLVVILGTFTVVEYRRERADILFRLSTIASHSARVIENNLRHEMLESDFEGVQGFLDVMGESGEFRVVYLLDPSGRVIFAPGGQDRGNRLDNRQPDCQPCHRLPVGTRPASVVVTAGDGQRVFRSMLPIENSSACAKCHDPGQRVLGLLLTDIPTAPLEEPLVASLRENLLWWAGTILVTVLIVNLVMSRLLIRRLEAIAQVLTRFGRGQRELRLESDNPDEIGQLASTFNEMGRNIQVEEARNRALSAEIRSHAARQRDLLRQLMTAQEEERKRVARDLHDDLGQDLAGLAVGLESVHHAWSNPPEQVIAQLRQIRAQIGEMTDRTYDIILALRPSALDDLGLVPALRAHAKHALKASGIQLVLDDRDLTRRLPSEIETALFRTLQEALSNVVRHAGATTVRVSLAAYGGTFEGEVADNGSGFDPGIVATDGSRSRGLGLTGMQERVALCNGTLEILSRQGAGTRIRIHIPLPQVTSV
jgi:signal transduction histidine kinase